MNKFATAAMAAVIASTSLGVASAAEAQSRHEQRIEREIRQDRRDFREDRREDRREYRQEVRQNERALARYQRAERRYNAGSYRRPAGYVQRNWAYGQRLPANYRTRTYYVDHSRYNLRAPPRGYQYTRVGNDVVLTAVATGLITAVIVGMFN